jgi:hypothetical protein
MSETTVNENAKSNDSVNKVSHIADVVSNEMPFFTKSSSLVLSYYCNNAKDILNAQNFLKIPPNSRCVYVNESLKVFIRFNTKQEMKKYYKFARKHDCSLVLLQHEYSNKVEYIMQIYGDTIEALIERLRNFNKKYL